MEEQTLIIASPAGLAWQHLGVHPRHGIVVPLFSLRTRNGGGIGEYLDLIPLISWCHQVGFDAIQLLPLNDPGHDSSPYNALSSHALNPLHLALYALPNADQHPSLLKIHSQLEALNTTKKVDYQQVRELKTAYLQAYLDLERTNLENHHLNDFRKKNHWLEPYALFKTLKKKYAWTPSRTWPNEDLDKIRADHATEINDEILVQFFCFQQMAQVKQQAQASKVLIKGDIPILLSGDSADVWFHPQLFDFNLSAGAPPDYYAPEGQNWGFPLYRWKERQNELYAWWRERMTTAASLYDLYRLDHVVGFYRIWGIPEGKTAHEGHFVPEDRAQWIQHGETILKFLLETTTLLPIGEDLGTIPPEVRKNLTALGICGTKVMRWERNWETDRRYIHLKDYPVLSMTTLSTHDSESVGQWWEDAPEEGKLFCEMLGIIWEPLLSEENRKAILRASHATPSLFHINLLQEYLALVPEFSWPTAQEDRVNTPGIVSDENWSYRYRPYLDEIVANTDFLKGLLS